MIRSATVGAIFLSSSRRRKKKSPSFTVRSGYIPSFIACAFLTIRLDCA